MAIRKKRARIETPKAQPRFMDAGHIDGNLNQTSIKGCLLFISAFIFQTVIVSA